MQRDGVLSFPAEGGAFATQSYATQSYATQSYATQSYATQSYATQSYATQSYPDRVLAALVPFGSAEYGDEEETNDPSCARKHRGL